MQDATAKLDSLREVIDLQLRMDLSRVVSQAGRIDSELNDLYASVKNLVTNLKDKLQTVTGPANRCAQGDQGRALQDAGQHGRPLLC